MASEKEINDLLQAAKKLQRTCQRLLQMTIALRDDQQTATTTTPAPQQPERTLQ